jgi:hypothetical protein
MFRLRRFGIVDAWWALGFAVGFSVAGVLALATLVNDLIWSPAAAMLRYIVTICVAGLAGSMVGAWVGHGVATIWERLDLRRHQRSYELDAADSGQGK